MSVDSQAQNELLTLRKNLAGKAAVVSGGTTGIGRAIALMLASEGVKVLIFGRHEPELQEALDKIRATGMDAYGLTADLTNPADIRRIFEAADRDLGRIDILVNNASLAANRLEDYPYEEWIYILQTNLIGYMACFQEGLKRMQNQRDGHIINIGSMSADLREKGASLYVTAKSAIQGFSESVRKEVNDRNIKVTLIEPGATGTDMNQESGSSHEEEFRTMQMLTPEDIAECVRFCLTLPQRVDVVTMQVRPHMQVI